MDRVNAPSLVTAEIIAVGTELLGATRLDTNSLFLATRLGDFGIELRAKSVVGDDRARLRAVFLSAMSRADLVILTGGLGPTDDDLTREVVAAALDRPLSEDPAIVDRIRKRFERRGLRMPDVNRRQAMVPERHGARIDDRARRSCRRVTPRTPTRAQADVRCVV
jgi:molybdenum cofactor synthesis domain-containing protein